MNVDAGEVTNSGTAVAGATTVTGGELIVNNAGALNGAATVSGGTLDIDGGTTAVIENTGGTVEIGGGKVASLDNTSGTGTLTAGNIAGALNVDAGEVTNSGTAVAGATTVTGGELIVDGTGALNGASTVSGGTLDINGGSTAAIENTGGAVEIGGGTVASLDNTSGTGTLTAGNIAGALNVDAGEVTNSGTAVAGATTVTGGELIVDGTGALNGASTVSGGTLDIDGGSTAAVENTGGTVEIGGGTVASLDNTSGAFVMSAGTVMQGVRIVAGSANIAGGTIGGDLEIASGDVTTTGGTVEGALSQTGGALALGSAVVGDVTVSGGTLDLNDGAVVGRLSNAGTVLFDGGSVGTVDNFGAFSIAGTRSVSGDFSNAGTLDATTPGADTLNVGGAFTSSGDIRNDAETGLTIISETITIAEGATFGGAQSIDGTLVLDGATTLATNSTIAGDVTVTQSLSNTGQTGVSGSLTLTNDALDNTGALSVAENGRISGVSVLTNRDGGQVDIAAGGSIATGSTINDGAGSVLRITGALTTDSGVFNRNGGQLVTLQGADVSGQITNDADLDLAGGRTGTLSNAVGGTTDVSADTTVQGSVVNAGQLDVTGGTLTVTEGPVTNLSGAALTVARDGTLGSGLLNRAGATATLAGTVTGNVDNLASATLTGAGGRIAGALRNLGTVNVADGEPFAVDGGLANLAEATLVLSGGLDGAVENFGTVTLGDSDAAITGAFDTNGDLTVTAGQTLDVGGGTFLQNGSTNTIDGTLSGAVRANAGSTLRLGADGILGSAGQRVVNAGADVFAINGTVLGTLATTGGSLTQLGDGAVLGGLDSGGGTFSLQDGTVGTVVRIAGDARFAGTIAFDADLSTGSVSSDRIDVGGDLSGENVTLSFANIGGDSGDIDGLVLFNYEGDNTLSFGTIEGTPEFGRFEYFVQDNGAGSITLQSQVNSGIASLAATVGLTQTLVGAVINRPTPPFVTGLADDPGESPCGGGGWARLTGGQANAEGDFRDVRRGSGGRTPVDLSYQGIQLGGDFACFDDRYFNGFDMAFGAVGGYNRGSSVNEVRTLDPLTGQATGPLGSVTNTDFTQTYGGIYATASRGPLFVDLQYRLETTKYDSSNIELIPGAAFDLDDQRYETKGQTLSGAVSYSWPIKAFEGMSFVGSAGFSFSNYETDEIDLGTDGRLELADGEARLGFISGTVSQTKFLPDEVSLINYFATATYYNDFGDDPSAVFTDNQGRANEIALSNLGSYGELSAGLNYVRLLDPVGTVSPRQLNAAIRIDARTGSNVESWGVTGQVRLQF
ncbi:hypothetical protein KDD17_17435 [Sulfitobacter albidus]|uniref:Autotransporter domain-containing protein n=1 Tax=Sulfitobacter albidus TaxID=2829501 RepID=A0A975PNU6_9RHOB|nr:hypothetical protein [Sulfitobacter albidus]QUJ78124.1 hypothetical protein KDD17_17435 [Sulfitobacter albidus]